MKSNFSGSRNAHARFSGLKNVTLGRTLLTMLAVGFGLTSASKAPAQMPDADDIGSGASTIASVISIKDVERDTRVPVTAVSFDLDGYIIEEPSGVRIRAPFVDHRLAVLRFARSTDGQTYLVNEGDAPVLYLAEDFLLTSAVGGTVTWRPLPAGYADASPIYLCLVALWSEYTQLSFNGHTLWIGGFGGPSRDAMIALPNATVKVGKQQFTVTEYQRYSRTHKGRRIPSLDTAVSTSEKKKWWLRRDSSYTDNKESILHGHDHENGPANSNQGGYKGDEHKQTNDKTDKANKADKSGRQDTGTGQKPSSDKVKCK